MSLLWDVRHVSVTGSTNDDAKKAAEEGASEGYVIAARTQTAGRGRHGRSWHSPEGNLYCSILLRPNFSNHNLTNFSFVAALAIFDTIKTILPSSDVTLKWPNDVLIEGKKISGILLEAGTSWLVIGIGLNILHCPENTPFPATSFYAAGAQNMTAEIVLDSLLMNLVVWLERLKSEGFSSIRTAWLDRAMRGPMTVKLGTGELHGDFLGLDIDGSLRLGLVNGTERSIATGDIFPGSRN